MADMRRFRFVFITDNRFGYSSTVWAGIIFIRIIYAATEITMPLMGATKKGMTLAVRYAIPEPMAKAMMPTQFIPAVGLPGELVLLSTEMFIEGTAVKPSGSNGQDFATRRVCRDGNTVERTEEPSPHYGRGR
jgi:hypothetical protein